jgi:hypothetical protein
MFLSNQMKKNLLMFLYMVYHYLCQIPKYCFFFSCPCRWRGERGLVDRLERLGGLLNYLI